MHTVKRTRAQAQSSRRVADAIAEELGLPKAWTRKKAWQDTLLLLADRVLEVARKEAQRERP